MRVYINGKPSEIEAKNIKEMLIFLGFEPEMVALECDEEIVPRAQWEEKVPRDGARYEVVHFVGGG